MNRLRVFTVLLVVLLTGEAASALEIREKRWGFDGKVRPGRFNILSVLVDHPGGDAFEGHLSLTESRGMEKPVGAPLLQPVYLTAGTRRWVQFHVFVSQPGGEWLLRWGKRPRDLEKIDGAQFGPPTTVLLIDPESPFADSGGVRAFPDDLFPTTVAATDALHALVLDHVPRWEPARREAFLDWLRSGGTVHLLPGADGAYLVFPEALAVLNASAERTHLGAGLIVRHPATRREVTEGYLTGRGYPAPQLKTDVKVLLYNLDTHLLQKLAALTKPEIAWWLIYVLTAGYVLVVGPAHFRWSKRLPYLRSIALLLAVVAGFAGAFALAGRRGANEQQQVHALAIAQSLGNGRYNVSQWISAFVTRGDLYKFTHTAPANLYSAASDFDTVNGALFNGRDGRFEVDVPLFSTRPFVHRAVLQGDRTDVSVADWQLDEGGDALRSIVLVPGEGFTTRVGLAWLQHRERFYQLKNVGDRWTLDGKGKSASEFFSDTYFAQQNSSGNSGVMIFGGGGDDRGPKTPDAWMGGTGPLLMARTLGNIEGLANYVTRAVPPPDQARVFFFTTYPDGFHLQDKRFRSQEGRVLYVQDVFKP